MLHTNTRCGTEPRHFRWSNTYTVGQTKAGERRKECLWWWWLVVMSVLRRQRWDSGGHVRGRRLLLRHLHGHFISGQDVLYRGDTKNKLVDVCVSSVSSGLSEELFFFFFLASTTQQHTLHQWSIGGCVSVWQHWEVTRGCCPPHPFQTQFCGSKGWMYTGCLCLSLSVY